MPVCNYSAELSDEDGEEQYSESFQAVSDEEAVQFALKEFGRNVDNICRVKEGQNFLIWEASPTVYLKYIAEGAESIDDVIGVLTGVAKELEKLKASGVVLEAVDNGFVHMKRPDSHFDVDD
jgi:vacuolar-type H+-ATPase subunit I/STV1